MPEKPFRLSVKILIQNSDREFLFLQRSNGSSWQSGKWDLPGGKLRNGERMEEALKREVFEETGISVHLTGLAGAVEDRVEDFRIVHLIMKGKCDDCCVELSREHEKFRWMSLEAAQDLDLCPYLNNLRVD